MQMMSNNSNQKSMINFARCEKTSNPNRKLLIVGTIRLGIMDRTIATHRARGINEDLEQALKQVAEEFGESCDSEALAREDGKLSPIGRYIKRLVELYKGGHRGIQDHE